MIGLPAMVLLGFAVGRGSTAVDDWFLRTGADRPVLGRLLFFSDPGTLGVLIVVAAGVAVWRRRWRLVAAVVLTPVVGVVASRLLKQVFGREKGVWSALAYPSGHVTVTVTVLGMVALVLGATRWVVAVAAAFVALAMLGQSFTYHYFTDTVGALLLGTSLVCMAAWAAKLDRCQPGCDVHHSGG